MLPFKDYILHPEMTATVLLEHFGGWIPDKTYIQLMYRLKMGKRLNLRNPQTYNEKLQWLKLYNRKPEFTTMVDKYAVKEYVAQRIGTEYIIPTLGVWERPEDIDWNKLPDRFVLKTTHGGGNTGVVICKDKSKFDIQGTIMKLNKSLKQDLYKTLREWPYKDVPRRILAEQFVGGGDYQLVSDNSSKFNNSDLPDYKFFCFDGEVKALFVGTERSSGDVKFDYFDADFNHLDLIQQHPMSGRQLKKPVCFDEMKRIAGLLSEGIPHVRVDLYNVEGRIYFGEMTFTHHGGLVPFHPNKWDYTFGNWIHLPQKY